jgi:hypothetical protein
VAMSAKRKRCRVCKKSWAAKRRTECLACRRRIEQAERDAQPRRVCSVCKREKRITYFYAWTNRGQPRLSGECKACKRKKMRARYLAVQADPYLARRERERKMSWEATQRKQGLNPERCRRYRERLKRERPEVYQQQLEDARIRHRLHSEQQGTQAGTARAVVVEPVETPLPIEPLVEFLARVPEEVISDSLQRTIYRVTHESEAVSMVIADRIITAYGSSLSNVYPELYA